MAIRGVRKTLPQSILILLPRQWAAEVLASRLSHGNTSLECHPPSFCMNIKTKGLQNCNLQLIDFKEPTQQVD